VLAHSNCKRLHLTSQAVVELPSDLSITAVDVAAHETIASLAEGHGELTGLALWLMAERQKVIKQPCCHTLSYKALCAGSTRQRMHEVSWEMYALTALSFSDKANSCIADMLCC